MRRHTIGYASISFVLMCAPMKTGAREPARTTGEETESLRPSEVAMDVRAIGSLDRRIVCSLILCQQAKSALGKGKARRRFPIARARVSYRLLSYLNYRFRLLQNFRRRQQGHIKLSAQNRKYKYEYVSNNPGTPPFG